VSRPSLLSAAQQAEADRNRILTNLEGSAAGKPSRGRTALVAGIGLLALAAAGGAWFGADTMQAANQAGPASTPVATVLATAPAPADVLAPAAATIHDEQAPQHRPTLDDMLNSRPETAPGTTANVLSNALEAPSKAKPAAPKAGNTASKNTASKEKPLRKPAPPKQESDSDVALLAALLVHTQANMPTRASALAQLKQCGKMSAPEAEQCRVRVCDARQVPGCDASATAPSTP
jgi:hypothetical protein